MQIFSIFAGQSAAKLMYDYKKYIGLTKGVLTIIDIVKISENKKHVIVKCKCSVCGNISETRLDRFTNQKPYAEHYCVHCRDSYYLNEAKKRLIGRINGALECIDVVLTNSEDPHKRLQAVCRCSRCGSITYVRPERIASNTYSPQSCSNCLRDLYRQRNLERYQRSSRSETLAKYKLKHHDDLRLRSIKSNAIARNIQFLLTKEEALALLHSDCYYCGEPHADGIDRLDSIGDYSKENCVPCCGICNIMKNKFSLEIFLKHVSAIYNKHCTSEGSSTIPKGSTSQANGDGNGENPENGL